MANIRFFWNGIKGSDGKLQPAQITNGAYYNLPAGTITIYAKKYSGFSEEVRAAFGSIENNSDSQTDYFETDKIRVVPTHPLYAAVKAAADKRDARYA